MHQTGFFLVHLTMISRIWMRIWMRPSSDNHANAALSGRDDPAAVYM